MRRRQAIDGRQLVEQGGIHGDDYRLQAVEPHAPPVQGLVRSRPLRTGMLLHCVDVVDLRPFEVSLTLQAGLHVTMLLDGGADIAYGVRRFELRARSRPHARAVGLLIALARPDDFLRRARVGRHERSVGVVLPPPWLAANGLAPEALDGFGGEHLQALHWQPSARLQSLGAELLLEIQREPDGGAPHFSELYFEAVGLLIAHEALAALPAREPVLAAAPLAGADAAAGAAPDATAGAVEARTSANGALRRPLPDRAERIWRLLDSGRADEWPLEQIASHVGMSVSTLQRHCLRVHGCTAVELIRRRRLRAAYRALAEQGVSVTRAAMLAGYGSTSSFTTAFRREFGLGPRAVRDGAG